MCNNIEGFYDCVDIDECENWENFCYGNVLCFNILGNYVCCCIWGFEGDGRIVVFFLLICDLKFLIMCYGNINKDKCCYGMGDFDYEIIYVIVDILKEL